MGRVCQLVSFVLSALVWQTYQFPSLVNNEFGVETLNKIDAKLIRESLFSSDREKRSPRRRGKKLNLKNKDDSSSESEPSSEEDSPETENDYSAEDGTDNDTDTEDDYSIEDNNNNDNDYSIEDNNDNDDDNDYSVEVSQVERLRRGPRRGKQRSKRSESSEEDGSASSSEEEETTEASSLVRSKRSEDSSE